MRFCYNHIIRAHVVRGEIEYALPRILIFCQVAASTWKQDRQLTRADAPTTWRYDLSAVCMFPKMLCDLGAGNAPNPLPFPADENQSEIKCRSQLIQAVREYPSMFAP
jgi:hypothetical protein